MYDLFVPDCLSFKPLDFYARHLCSDNLTDNQSEDPGHALIRGKAVGTLSREEGLAERGDLVARSAQTLVEVVLHSRKVPGWSLS